MAFESSPLLSAIDIMENKNRCCLESKRYIEYKLIGLTPNPILLPQGFRVNSSWGVTPKSLRVYFRVETHPKQGKNKLVSW